MSPGARGRSAFAVLAAVVAAAATATPSAHASRSLKLGIMDDARVFGQPENAFAQLGVLKPEVLRVNLWWKDVAPRKPDAPTSHEDLAYEWGAYDAVAVEADELGIKLLFTIIGTPGWANADSGWNRPPSEFGSVRAFATAAAKRYDGTYVQAASDPAGVPIRLPRVTMWTAWNEPNMSYWLRPVSWTRSVGYTRAIGRVYARVCNAIVGGVHAGQPDEPGEKVACGVTAPRKWWSSNTTVSPLEFLRAIRRAGARPDVYAHHPHPLKANLPPGTNPGTTNFIGLGNIDLLQRELQRLYGTEMRLWLTEYGYQTNPPDAYGISLRKQSQYLKEAYAIVKRNRKIDLLIWFLLADEVEISRWQSGLMFDQSFRTGDPKPSFWRFSCLAVNHSAALC